MFELTNIQFHSNAKIFKKQTKKMIKFAHKNYVSKSQNACTFIDRSTIKWEEGIKMPEVYNEEIEFEIVDMHQFGFNPEELQAIMHGSVNIKQKQKEGEWRVYTYEEEKEKYIGYLSAKIKKVVKQSEEQKITEVILRGLKVVPEAGYVTINNGKKVLKSKLGKGNKGQFIYHFKINQNQFMKSTDKKNGVIVEFYAQDNELIGKSKFDLKEKQKLYKGDLIQDNKNVGEISIEFNLSKSQIKKQPKINETQSTIGNSKISLYKLRSMSESILSRFRQSDFLGKSRKKRMSVIQANGDIVFSSQKRFMIYEDKQTNIISYSKLPSMKYQDPTTKNYYKGASLGVGTKYDFTQFYKHNPGVGQYKLPSIFDRY